MKDIRHLMNEKLVGNLMKPFIDECGIIHIAYMATAMFYQRKWLPLVSTGLVRGEPQPFIPARRWVIERRVRVEKKGRRRHKCRCGRVWKGSDSGVTSVTITHQPQTPTTSGSAQCALICVLSRLSPAAFTILSVFLPTTNG